MLASIEQWFAAHPLAQWVAATVALFALTALANWFLRVSTPEAWERLKQERPRVAAVISMARALGVDPVKLLRAFATFVRGRWGGTPPPDAPPSDASPKPPAKSDGALHRAGLALACVALALSTGCSSLVASRPAYGAYVAPPERCAALDDRATLWGSVGATAGVLAGGAGLSTIPVSDHGVRVGLAVGAAVAGAVAAGATLVANQSSAAFVRDGCGAPDPKKQVGVMGAK